MNSFIYSNDNKRYHTFNYASRLRYNTKVFKVGLNAGFTCPNRDGKCGYGGCSFCNDIGSGDFQGNTHLNLLDQFEKGVEIQHKKWPDAKAIAYFQAFTNTYAPVEKLKELYDPFIHHPDVIALAIATRVDCLDDSIIEYLNSLTQIKDVYLELGLQTIHDETAKHMNRGYDYALFKEVYTKLKKTNLMLIVHVMNGYPTESVEDMIETVKEVGQLRPYGIKIHMLNVLKNSNLGMQYNSKAFKLLSLEEYIDCVVTQLRYIPKEVSLLRLTGDYSHEDLIEPQWIKNKIMVLNGIDKKMALMNVTQGDLCE
jgi:radical SAM protein (TIGR01212 family)